MELLNKGVSIRAACREIGVCRQIGQNWENGVTVIRKDGSVKHVPPLHPLSTRLISPRFLSEAERVLIADLFSQGLGPTTIGARVGRSASTISRELRRNSDAWGRYRPFDAHVRAAIRRQRPKTTKLAGNGELFHFVHAKLTCKWSPQQITRALRVRYPDNPSMRLCHESIYVAIYRPSSGLFRKPVGSPLRTGRDHRRAHTRATKARRRFAQPMLSIHEREFAPSDRSVPGHWEGDLIVGSHNRSVIGTLVERQTRYVKLLHLPSRDSQTLYAALVAGMGHLPEGLRKTLTWDQGTEMASHLDVTRDTGMTVYFCDPASPWQRGSNENTNGLLRQYFPKFTDLTKYRPQDLIQVENELNNRPRLILGDKPPVELFNQLLAFQKYPLLQ